MHQTERRFSEHRPRLFEFLAVTLAIVLGLLGWDFIISAIPFIWILLLTGSVIIGAFYIAFGFSAHRWFMMRSIQDRLSWKQVCLDVSLGLFIYISASLLDWILRR